MKEAPVRPYRILLMAALLLLLPGSIEAQSTIYLTPDSLFQLAEANSKQLQASRENIPYSHTGTDIAKEAQLPNLEAEAQLGYISNARVWDNHFDYLRTVSMPHVLNTYSVMASLDIFHGKSITNSIAKARLAEQVAALDYEKDREDVAFLLLSRYLDLATLYNQQKVYQSNIELAQKRLIDIEKMHQEGMVTHNDIVRGQLQLSQLHLQLTEIVNNIAITSHDIATVTGIPADVQIVVDSTLYERIHALSPADSGEGSIPELLAAEEKLKIEEKNIAIAKAEKLPVLSVFAGDNLNRPFLYTLEPLDVYMHFFEGGIKLRYSLSSLYKSDKHIQQARISYRMAEAQKEWVAQKTEMEIHAALVKLKEAHDQYHTRQENHLLAKDNYNNMYQKYLNHLAIMTDMMDASTALLQAQLELSDAQINMVYCWYHLKKASGHWHFFQ